MKTAPVKKAYKVARQEWMHVPNMFRFIAQVLGEGNKTKARELYEGMGLPEAVAKDLCSKKPTYTIELVDADECAFIKPIA